MTAVYDQHAQARQFENILNEFKRHCRIGRVTAKERPRAVDMGIARWREHVTGWKPLKGEGWRQVYETGAPQFIHIQTTS
jgi:hypothetical protein